MIAMASEDGICVLEFLDRRSAPAAARMFAARLDATVGPGRSAHLERLRRELDAYFRGKRRRFAVPLDLRGTPFQRTVWKRLARVPFGAILTYAQLAARAGRSSAVRAVGHANGRNPVSIVVPCHRVVGSDGELRGYGGGLWRKERLIALERDAVSSARRSSREGRTRGRPTRSRRATKSGR
jgi:AraC family transcriptional regulator of adaptative response/methylated-DNA-[protein]-cysteine methyltransferase